MGPGISVLLSATYIMNAAWGRRPRWTIYQESEWQVNGSELAGRSGWDCLGRQRICHRGTESQREAGEECTSKAKRCNAEDAEGRARRARRKAKREPRRNAKLMPSRRPTAPWRLWAASLEGNKSGAESRLYRRARKNAM